MTNRQTAAGLGLAIFTCMAMTACDKIDTKGGSRDLKTQRDSVSYGIGMDIGQSLKSQNFETSTLDLDKLKFGIQDRIAGAKPQMSDSQMQTVLMAFQQRMMARTDSVNKAKAEANEKAETEFLAKNAKEPGVVTTASGLQYKIEKEGKGKKPDSASKVTVHYTGTVLDGTVFDSSVKNGQPATFPVNGVIPGWTEALLMMPEGSKWKLWVPSKLAYGPQARGPIITPNSTLIFDVEFIAMAPAEPAPGPGAMPANPHAGHGH